VVAVQIHHARACPHRDALFAKVIILERIPVRHLIMIANIKRRNTIRRFLDAVSISIVNVGGRVRANGDARQTILLLNSNSTLRY
jgi:hypothetical protein